MISRLRNFFPSYCALCQATIPFGEPLCTACATELPWIAEACPGCALPSLGPGLCGVCQQQRTALHYTRAALHYVPPISTLIHGAKFEARLQQARLLGELLLKDWQAQGRPSPQAIIPIPLHTTRCRERGYNQAVEIARPLARALQVPLDRESCRRVHATRAQMDLDERARRHNMQQAFAVSAHIPWRHVLLIDDVMTTGSTVAACREALIAGGVATVEVLVVARVVKSHGSR